MIMLPAPPRPCTHTLSDAFLAALKRALIEIASSADKVRYMEGPLRAEFRDDPEMLAFARKNIFVIAKLLCERHTTIWINRSLSHGLEIYVDE